MACLQIFYELRRPLICMRNSVDHDPGRSRSRHDEHAPRIMTVDMLAQGAAPDGEYKIRGDDDVHEERPQSGLLDTAVTIIILL